MTKYTNINYFNNYINDINMVVCNMDDRRVII